ncbi:GPI transamidase subunit PIG-U [Carpediemonas membranifera]|uniref:GPI transamidase subunit PIG-U n=1 Tax=Carpediemonas membranifera TaxID=201153 RepID=A0A8J6EBK2_9EUKA|nr:GPI transamidase subunit PIG-U [Carpediemonas membranifera]|eukprot:KAG9397465.1 GPI transamidase subunit PIG-U [Carpediemonas membranifera]
MKGAVGILLSFLAAAALEQFVIEYGIEEATYATLIPLSLIVAALLLISLDHPLANAAAAVPAVVSCYMHSYIPTLVRILTSPSLPSSTDALFPVTMPLEPSFSLRWVLLLHVFREYGPMFVAIFALLPFLVSLPLAVRLASTRSTEARIVIVTAMYYSFIVCSHHASIADMVVVGAVLVLSLTRGERTEIQVVFSQGAMIFGLGVFYPAKYGWMVSCHTNCNYVLLFLLLAHFGLQRILLIALATGDSVPGKISLVKRAVGAVASRVRG